MSTASATISSVALTAEQINDGVFDSIIETATFLQEVLPMAQGWSTKIFLMIKWIRTSRLSIQNSLSPSSYHSRLEKCVFAMLKL